MQDQSVNLAPVWERVALWAILAAYIAFMLSLPCFPSTDGPVHMYYVHILDALLSRSNPQYMHYFRVRHFLPPYSLYYYALLAGSKFVPMLLADKLIICAYFVLFTFGFRFLARAIGPFARYTTPPVTLLLLNWALGMGFVNFCLSLSLTLWALGLWLRLQGKPKPAGRVGFLFLVTAVMLTHPIPLLLLLAVVASTVLARIVQASRQAHTFVLPPQGKADLLTLALALLNVGYVKLFTISNPLKQDEIGPRASYWSEMLGRVGIYAREHALAFVLGRSAPSMVYRTALLILLVGSIGLAVHQRLRNRKAGLWTVGDTFLLLGGLLFVGLPFIPDEFNGLYHFADRLMVCVWLAFLLAASGWVATASGQDHATGHTRDPHGNPVPAAERRSFAPAYLTAGILAFSAIANASLLYAANRLMRPTATVIAALDHTRLSPGQVGFIVEDGREPLGSIHENVAWNPYYWASIHIFRNNDLVLANAPWMDETLLPVGATDALPEQQIPALAYPFPAKLQGVLLAAPDGLRKSLAATTIFVVNQFDRPQQGGAEPLLRYAGPDASSWTCTDEGWYRLCQRPAETAH